VLAVAGTSVLAFRKPDTVGDHSFQDIQLGLLERKKTRRLGGMRAEAFRSRIASILSKTAGARVKRKFFNGLIAWPA
jgi:hypothetical protein